MTDQQQHEGDEEAIEDLEAPAAEQDDVAGDAACGKPSMICIQPTCELTAAECTKMSHRIDVFEH